MRYQFRKLSILLLIVVFGFCFSAFVSAQARSLKVIGTVEHNLNPLANTKVILFKNGKSVEIVYTKTNGEFQFDLDINYEYLIEVKKTGFLNKRIAFNTELPDDVSGRWTMEFAMSLFEGCEGVNTDALKDPVDRIKYSTNKSDFISDNAYVQNMRGRIQKLLTDIDRCHTDKFQNLVDEGDELYQSKQLAEARQKYEEALIMVPDNRYAQRRVDEINKQIGENRQNQQTYNTAISEADRLYTAGNYDAARKKYNEALRAVPQNNYPREKVAEIDRLVQEQNMAEQAKLETERKYNGLIAQGNAAYTAKNFEAAKTYYEQALLVKPGASFPQQRIAGLGPAIAKQKQQTLRKNANEQAYKEALAMGQNAMQSKDYDAAKQHFNKALMLKPEESYPQQMISEIDRMIEEQNRAEMLSRKAENEQQIAAALDKGDAMYKAKNYQAAAMAYQKALQLNPNDSYAKQRYNKSKSMMASANAEKQKTLEKAHQEKIKQADVLVAAASYQQAIAVYQQALLAKPDDALLKNKLADAEQKLAAEQQALGQRYSQTVLEADNLFKANRLAEAKTVYQRASGIKPAENYPKTQIAKIDTQIAEQTRFEDDRKAKEYKYNEAITQADRLYGQDKIEEAKTYYERALSLKPNETYPTGQISKINGQLAQISKTKQEKAAYEQRYNTVIASADKAYDKRDYETAKSGYMQALSMKPSESYPQQRLNKIAEFERIIAQKEAAQNAAIASAAAAASASTSPKPSKLSELNFTNDSERDKYLDGLKREYPQGVTLEIHEEKIKTTHRYVVYRGKEIREFRKVKFNWGGVEYSLNGKPITSQYFDTQVKVREGEYFKEIKL